jgi:hypothetical protein
LRWVDLFPDPGWRNPPPTPSDVPPTEPRKRAAWEAAHQTLFAFGRAVNLHRLAQMVDSMPAGTVVTGSDDFLRTVGWLILEAELRNAGAAVFKKGAS